MTGHQQAQQLKKQAGQSSKNHLANKTIKQKDQLTAASGKQVSQQSQGQHVQSTQVDVDELAREKVQEIEQSLEKATGSSLKWEAFTNWFSVLKQIITAADLHRTNDKDGKSSNEGRDNKHETGDSIYADFADDNEQFNAHVDLSEQFATNNVKWTIRVKAFKIVHRLVQLVLTGSNNVTSALPIRPSQNTPTASCLPPKVLIKHLPDLVRLSFVAATSPYDELKMQGLEMFRVLIEMFASHEEPEFPGHSILEQYKTQVLSAVKPAFNLDAPPYITAIASQICSLWICQGLEKNSSDVKRTYQLMLLSIEKLEGQSVNQHSKLYTESELEQERVDILGSWAHLYIASEESRFSEHHGRISRLTPSESEHLNGLVKAQVETLVDKWWEALKDYALLIMPSPKFIGTSHDNENVYTREVALRLFSTTWPKLVLALTIWLCSKDDPSSSSIPSDNTTTDPKTSSTTSLDCDKLSPRSYQKRVSKIKYCNFLCGIIMKELSRCIVNNKRESRSRHLTNSSILTLRSIHLMVSNKQCQQVYLDDLSLAQEFYRALYHITVMFGRDPCRSLLRETLDLMFSLIAKRISGRKENVHYGIAKIISCLMSSMKDIEIAYGEKSLLDIELNRLHLFVRLHNLMTLIRLAPNHAMSELQLQEALIAVFQEMLRFDKDPTVGITLADQLRDMYPHVEANTKNHSIDELFPDFCRRVEELLEMLFSSDRYCDSDKVNLSRANTLLRSMRVMIDQLDKVDSKEEKIQAYIQTLLKKFNIPDEELEELISAEAKKKRELIDFCLSQISTLKEACPDHFGDKLDPETRHQFDTAFSLQHKIKSKIDSKNKEMQKSRKPATSNSQKPQVAKIALKADFSNFYAKKT